MAKVMHPDSGGDRQAFQDLHANYIEALECFKAGSGNV